MGPSPNAVLSDIHQIASGVDTTVAVLGVLSNRKSRGMRRPRVRDGAGPSSLARIRLAGGDCHFGLGSTDCRSARASMPFVICSTGDALAFKAGVANQTSATYGGRARQGPRIGQRIETQFFGLLNAHAALADALPHCNYRVYISGNDISLVSSWMQRQLFALSFCLSQTDGRH